MTDGRAITGMTADSHARPDIPPHFSPQEFQFFRIRTAPVFEIEHGRVADAIPLHPRVRH